MTDYSTELENIRTATSLEEIEVIARSFPAKAEGNIGILYSGRVGNVSAEVIALELADKTGISIINKTERALFLADEIVSEEIEGAARRIFQSQGQDPQLAKQSAKNFLFGDARAAAHSATSVNGCLWGEASKEFAGSLRGHVVVVASTASPDRVLGRVEVPTVLSNPEITSFGGQPIAKLQAAYAQGGSASVLPEIQARFIQAAPRGIFIASDAIGRSPNQAILSKEFATTLDLDATRCTHAGELSASGKVVRASIGMSAAVSADEVTLARSALLRAPVRSEVLAATAAPEFTAARTPGTSALTKGLGAVGIAATAYDALTTSAKADDLRQQGSVLAARSELNHFAGRNVGAWAGAIAGAELGVVTFGKTPQTAIISGVAGGVAGSLAGERIADLQDAKRIYNQTDSDGVEYRFTGQEWARAATADLTADGIENPEGSDFAAGLEKSSELNYRATHAALDLASRDRPLPSNPFLLPASLEDKPTLERADWSHDPRTGGWHRDVFTHVEARHVRMSEREIASPERAALLDAQAIRAVAANVAAGPAATAARYELAHRSENWDRHGPMPAQVQAALSGADILTASDGRAYTRDTQATWRHEGKVATGSLGRELELTREALLPALAQHAEAMTRVYAQTTLPPQAQDRAELMWTYQRFGIAPNAESMDAVMLAVQRTHDAQGIHPSTTSLSPRPDSQGRYTIDSALDHLILHSDGVTRIAATTFTDDIARARDDIRSRSDAAPTTDLKEGPSQAPPLRSPSQPSEALQLPPAVTGQATARPGDSSLRLFVDARHPQHDLYATLKACLPEGTSERRLAQFTAECHRGGIGPRSLASIKIDGEQAVFATSSGWPRVEVDMGKPSPSLEESALHVQAQTTQTQGIHERELSRAPEMQH